jgi:hypothetical protein
VGSGLDLTASASKGHRKGGVASGRDVGDLVDYIPSADCRIGDNRLSEPLPLVRGEQAETESIGRQNNLRAEAQRLT